VTDMTSVLNLLKRNWLKLHEQLKRNNEETLYLMYRAITGALFWLFWSGLCA
jgi:hypothetical protein